MAGEFCTSGEVVVLGRRLHYAARGAGPAVLLIHGMGAASHAWDRLALPDFRLIAVDLPGCGRSEVIDGPQAPNDLAFLLHELMRELGHRTYSVVGHSLGALVGLELALMRSEQVRAAVLVDAAIKVSPAAHLLNVPLLAEVAAAAGGALPVPRSLIRLYLHVLFGDPRRITEATIEAYARTTSNPHYLQVMVAEVKGLLAWTPGDRVKALRVPTLVAWGERDPFLPVASGERFASLLPGARFVAVPGCGHAPPDECPEVLGAIVGPFLRDQNALPIRAVRP